MKRTFLAAMVLALLPACTPSPSATPAATLMPASSSSVPSPARPTIITRAQSPDEAFDYLWLQLAQMPFFRAHD